MSRTRTENGIKWEYSDSEGMWFAKKGADNFRVCRGDSKGRKSEWWIFKNEVRIGWAATMADAMSMA